MKPFLIALVALVAISVGANQILTEIGFSTSTAGTSTGNVRLTD